MNDHRPHPMTDEGAAEASSKSLGHDAATQAGTNSRTGRREMPSYNMAFEPGNKVGRYRLLAPIASGGMAQVWAARPEGFGFARTIALKLIRHEYAADEEYVRMFIDEATVAAAIQHPNVCETYELGREDGILFMALEWVAGDSLAGVLHRPDGMEPLSYRMAARVVADACAGLHAAHEATDSDGRLLNVVHRDVSPPNILLSLHGQVKVSDFGIAKARYQLHSKTKTGEIKGKFSYIAPEQIGGKLVDRRADVFALGCVLYVATLGLRPFGSGPRAMGKILTGDYKRPSSLVENYPRELEVVIEKCLQRYPNDRYSNTDEMRLELERWLLTSGDSIGAKDVAQLVQARMDPEKRRVTEALLRSNQVLADAVAEQLMRNEETQTPTATSSVMFGPAASETHAPIPVPGRKTASKPAVRFLPFASMPTKDDADDTDLEQVAPIIATPTPPNDAPTVPPKAQPDSMAHRDDLPHRSSSRGLRAAADQNKGSQLPYGWLALGIAIAATILIALTWSNCGASPDDSVTHTR
jgi:serine/threonine protein kinase